MKNRLRSIDTFRGICIVWMIVGHSMGWWIRPMDYYTDFFYYVNTFFDALGAAGFLFISGTSLTLSYNRKILDIKELNIHEYKKYRMKYFLRAGLLLFVGLIYNFTMVIRNFDWRFLWSWFILQTIPVSMILIWPILKYRKITKITIAINILLLNELLFYFLLPFSNTNTHFAIFYYFLYNEIQLSPIFRYFPFFLIGSVIGDFLSSNVNKRASNKNLLISFIFPLLIIGFILIIVSVFIIPLDILEKFNINWPIYAIGTHLFVYSILFAIEFLSSKKLKKEHRFFYYFSYYSFTIFLLHYPIYFFFNQSLAGYIYFLIIPIVLIFIRTLSKLAYNNFGPTLSLKYQLSRLSTRIAEILIYNDKSSKRIKNLLYKKIGKD